MREINLLRWHQPEYQANQKMQIKWFVTTAVIFSFFVIAHFSLTKLVYQSALEELDLKNKSESVEGSRQDDRALDQLQMSQKKVWKMLSILNCVNQNENPDKLQVTQIISQEKQINIKGLVDSTATLKKAYSFCFNKDSSISSMIFNHKNKTDFLQFSLIII